jgi:hypothetical protein
MDECAPCGPGTSSEAGAWRCTDCLPGSFAAGGEPECLPCPPGSATDKEAQAQCTFCLDGWYAGTGWTECRTCGMYDHAQLTNGVPNGVRCTGGELNGTKPGFWAEYAVTEDSANSTRVWKCPIPGTCLGGEISTCLEGFTGPLCENCAPTYYGNPKKDGCTACPPDMVELGMLNRLYWSIIVMALAFAVGATFVFLLFKSSFLDQAINFFYRVRTNPVMAITQARTRVYLWRAIDPKLQICAMDISIPASTLTTCMRAQALTPSDDDP